MALDFAGANRTRSGGGCATRIRDGEVVLIGDSHSVGELGQNLVQELQREVNPRVSRFAAVSAATSHWVRGRLGSLRGGGSNGICRRNQSGEMNTSPRGLPDLDQLFVRGTKPSAVVVALGTNDAGSICNTAMADDNFTTVKELIRKIPAESPCFWIGPPPYPEGPVARSCRDGRYAKFVARLKEVVSTARDQGGASCIFIDSREMRPVENGPDLCVGGRPLRANAGDQLHFRGAEAKKWANCAAQKIKAAMTPEGPTAPPLRTPAPSTPRALPPRSPVFEATT